MQFIKPFEDIRLDDIALVGGKNASLGQMISSLSEKGIRVPHGFAITAAAYWYFLEANKLLEPIREIIGTLADVHDLPRLRVAAAKVRALIEHAKMPDDLAQEIKQAYKELSKRYGQEAIDVAVRSSATAEDLPTASFAGQQETYLNIQGNAALLESCKKSFASLFTDRAIVYRVEQGFDHFKVGLSIGVQKMVRSDKSCSGVAFSLDTETGFSDVIMINAAYGLGETIVKGMVVPDEFAIHKPTLAQGFAPIIKKYCGDKQEKVVYGDTTHPTKIVPVPEDERLRFSLNDKEILELARMVLDIEEYYSARKNAWSPMDVEWAQDGIDRQLYIVQARPETVHALKRQDVLTRYRLKIDPDQERSLKVLVTGRSIGQKITAGVVRVIHSVQEIDRVEKGDILVTEMTDPDWVPAMRRAAGIITNRGGRTCHAAIVSRELGVPAIVGAYRATETLHDEQYITLDCSQGEEGYVYEGQLPFEVTEISLEHVPKLDVEIMVNVAAPDRALTLSFLPVEGVGLARIEFIITNSIKIHPMALLHLDKVTDESVRKKIYEITSAYKDGAQFFVQTLAQGIGMIAAAFYPRPVIVRLSDFKSNEYCNLLGGKDFEPIEANPMLGFRGAFRYDHESYREAFALECAALKAVRDVMGLRNIKIMVPFVRTISEARRVIDILAQHGLERHKDDLELVMMCEVPSNVILIDEFCTLFDGFSIGSNDLAQLTLGVDRDSSLLAHAFDERDPAVIAMMRMAIEGAHNNDRYIGICGQAPSDYPELAQLLMEADIDSMSLNPDAVIPFLMRYV